MENSKQIKKIERIMAVSVFAFLIVLVITIFSFIELGSVRRKNAEYNEFIISLQSQKSSLELGIEEMQTEEYLNKKARDYLGMIKDGETLYIYD